MKNNYFFIVISIFLIQSTILYSQYDVFWAIENKDLYHLKILLKQNKQLVTTKNLDGLYPLHHAAIHCFAPATLLLLKHGANINKSDEKGNTPLMYALTAQAHQKTNYMDNLKILLDNGATVKKSLPILDSHILYHHPQIIEQLFLYGALITLQNESEKSVIYECVKNNNFKALSLYVRYGAHLQLKNNNSLNSYEYTFTQTQKKEKLYKKIKSLINLINLDDYCLVQKLHDAHKNNKRTSLIKLAIDNKFMKAIKSDALIKTTKNLVKHVSVEPKVQIIRASWENLKFLMNAHNITPEQTLLKRCYYNSTIDIGRLIGNLNTQLDIQLTIEKALTTAVMKNYQKLQKRIEPWAIQY